MTYGGSPKPAPSSPANVYDWRTQNQSFTSMAALSGHSAVLTGSDDPEKIRGFDVGADFFSILGVKALRGRSAFTPEDSAWKGTKSVTRIALGATPSRVVQMVVREGVAMVAVGVGVGLAGALALKPTDPAMAMRAD
jgi:hypothetical protein